MRSVISFFFVLPIALSAGCKSRSFENDSNAEATNIKPEVVNANAYNAFNMWRDGGKLEVTSFPDNIPVANLKPDGPFGGIFTVAVKDYHRNRDPLFPQSTVFIGKPTENIEVNGDVLKYPLLYNRLLSIQFTNTKKLMNHFDAMHYCKSKGLRLPTVRELFDYCAAGVTEPNYGPNFVGSKYPANARCARSVIWTVALDASNPNMVWMWNSAVGDVYPLDPNNAFRLVMCAGTKK